MGKKNPMEEILLAKGYIRHGDTFVPPPKIKVNTLEIKEGVFNAETVWGINYNETKEMFEKMQNTPVTFQTIGETTISSTAKPLIVFEVDPIGAPRMTKSDQWKNDPSHADLKRRQRKPVAQYFRFKDAVKAQAAKMNFVLPESFHAVCVIPMSHSWSNKKKGQMDGARHQQKPDWDNIGKAICDTLMSNDAVIWDCRITKYWGRSGKIIIYQL